jgi:hypothetical protein
MKVLLRIALNLANNIAVQARRAESVRHETEQQSRRRLEHAC